MSVVWIASYPRSGNTWMRYLMHEYVLGPVESTAQLNRAIGWVNHIPPDDPSVQAPQQALFVKTHRVCGPDHPMIQNTSALIYLVRHPKDVVKSAYNWGKLKYPKKNALFTPKMYTREFISFGGAESWIREGFGQMEQNVRSWLHAASQIPSVVVRYEDLTSDPAGCLREIIAMLGQEPDEQKIAKVLERTKISRLREMEKAEKQSGDFGLARGGDEPQAKDRHFFHKGKVSGSLADFCPELEEQFDKRFGPLMDLLDYPYRLNASVA